MTERGGSGPVGTLVVVGASAGGIEALTTLVSTLPSDFRAPIVIAQHLDPSRLSHLEQILGRKSRLPVRTVNESEPLQAGVVFVVPADHQVDITDHRVRVSNEPGRRPAPSIDRLLGSAAEVFGEHLIAVILTGLGSDGADGARRVKEAGGTVVIQNPQTASHPEMPLSLPPPIVDIVADLEAIGPLLNELLDESYAPDQPDDDRRLRTLLEQVRARSGIDFSNYKEPTVRRRLQRRMLDTGSHTLEAYLRYLRRHAEEYDRLANSFLIKVTDFFRDGDLFTHLREVLLPQLIREARARGNELRLWSAGCATGEEAYSLGILLAELLGDELDGLTVRIFATDVDAGAVAFARRGIFSAAALDALGTEVRDKYFSRVEWGFEVRKRIRSLVIFGQHDLGQRAPFPRIDLVLCRNVLIYFTPELQRRFLQLFAFALREGGYLVLGKAETTTPLPIYFSLVNTRLKVFRRQGERVLIPPSRIRDAAPVPTGRASLQPLELGVRKREVTRAQARQAGTLTTAERAEQVLREWPVGVVVVDRRYDIQTINAAARRLLGIHTPALDEDVVHLAHRGLGEPLRDVVDAALSGQELRVTQEVTSLPDTPGERRFVELSAFVPSGGDRVDLSDSIVVVIDDVTARESLARETAKRLADTEERARHLQALLDESTRTVRQLLQANQELATTNTSLRSANEELLVGNEEAQAAMEEVETLNEEQQATNEELETLNEELQATVEELNATNEDLQARGIELQDQAAEREQLLATLNHERQRLETILTSMADAVLVVDARGETVATNAAFGELFGHELPPLEDASGERVLARASPAQRAGRGETFAQAFTICTADGRRRWFEASGRPIRSDGELQGGVVVIRDVTDRSLRQLQEEFVALAGHELRTPLAALRGSLQLLGRAIGRSADQAQLAHYVGIGLEQTDLLGALVQDLADVVRIQTGHLSLEQRALDLRQLVGETVELARPMATSVEIGTDLPPEPVMVEGDARRLRQIVLNLLANALQHGASTDGPEVRVRPEGGEAILEVRDSGRGIAEEDRERIFERFYRPATSAGSGLGVGLFLVRALVTAHGGGIRAEPGEGRGTRFIVHLPRVSQG